MIRKLSILSSISGDRAVVLPVLIPGFDCIGDSVVSVNSSLLLLLDKETASEQKYYLFFDCLEKVKRTRIVIIE